MLSAVHVGPVPELLVWVGHEMLQSNVMKNVSILEKPNNYYHHGYEPIRK